MDPVWPFGSGGGGPEEFDPPPQADKTRSPSPRIPERTFLSDIDFPIVSVTQTSFL